MGGITTPLFRVEGVDETTHKHALYVLEKSYLQMHKQSLVNLSKQYVYMVTSSARDREWSGVRNTGQL